ncbi:MAG: hypothetical protein M0Z85_12200 [Gammaproteobacteria bacterium]|nr:hypothetical protein [Gammaproteobacteria bacterium]
MSHHADETQAGSPQGIEESQTPGDEGARAPNAASRPQAAPIPQAIPIRYVVHAIIARAQSEQHYRALYAKARQEAADAARGGAG